MDAATGEGEGGQPGAGRGASVALAAAFGLLLMALPLEPPRARPEAARPPARGAARLLWGVPLDLNREDAVQFEALAGIGPSRAQAIAASRPFCRVSELDRVAGIGPRTLLRVRGQVSVPDPPAACATSGALMK